MGFAELTQSVFLDDALSHWAIHAPHAEALRSGERAISYETLNKMADRFAGFLLSQDVQIGDRVAICSAKSAAAIAALYGALRIGAIYVPINPLAPEGRMRSALNKTEPSCIFADDLRLKRLEDLGASYFIAGLSEVLQLECDRAPQTLRQSQRAPTDGAYILLTSGTTGEPKGILHTHQSGMAYAKAAADICALSSIDRVSHHTPLHFDMSIFDIFSTAQAAACAVLIPESHTKFPASLSKMMEEERITVWYSVPFALTQLATRGALVERDLSALRVVMFAGEQMPPSTISAFAAHASKAVFLNAYGPTETNHCTTARFTHDMLDGVTALPIGFPNDGVITRIGATEVHEEEGELLVAGDQIMQSYWQDDPTSSERMVVLPDSMGIPRQFYRTGDIVRLDDTGAFVLIGRQDRQVKVRGYRVELDEIELALTNTPQVKEAAVMISEDVICAFVATHPGCEVDSVTDYISDILPAYAIPENILHVPHLARTSTGKVDRKALLEALRCGHAA
ncbi:MAG: AMP-binding protein [Pseudomonadota bacterium]